MRSRTPRLLQGFVLLLLTAQLQATESAPPPATNVAPAADAAIENSVVRIFSSVRLPDALRPWNKQAATEVSGSGVIIDGNRILTNAHVVAYASQVQVQANQSGDKVNATVVVAAPAVDLAILKLDDDSFFRTRKPVARDATLPRPKDEVLAYGYPTGGTTLSITRGIVSRVEYAGYNPLGAGLRVQIDAAINPGNSGGPVIDHGKLAGLAYATLLGGQNISYIIPTEEIELFLHDVADGHYDGKPAMFDELQTLENPALRASLNLPPETTGTIVRRPFEGFGPSPLREWDVITRIGDAPIDDQGMVLVGDLRIRFPYLIQKLAQDGQVPLTVVRAGKLLKLRLPVQSVRPMMVPDLRGRYPPYFIYGPMVFSVATTQFIQASASRLPLLMAAGSPLLARFGDVPDSSRQEFVVVTTPLFSHRLSTGYSNPAGAVVESVNGIHIRSLAHLVGVLRDLKDDYVTIRFEQRGGETLVFRRDDIVAATEEILVDNGIRAQGSEELMAIWRNEARAH